MRWNLEAIGKEPGKLPDSSRVFVTTDNGTTWVPLNFNGTGPDGHVGNITNTTNFSGSSTPAYNLDNNNNPASGFVSCQWTDISQGCSTDVQIDIHFPVAINGVKVTATGVPGDGAGANLFNPYVGYDPDNPPVPPAGPTPTVSAVSPNRGPLDGGQAVTITGTNFVDGDTEVEITGSGSITFTYRKGAL